MKQEERKNGGYQKVRLVRRAPWRRAFPFESHLGASWQLMLNLALSLNSLRGNERCNLLSPFFLSPLPSPSLTTEYWSQKDFGCGGKADNGQGSCQTDQKLKQSHFGEMEWEESKGERLICPSLPYGRSGLLRSALWVYDWTGELPRQRGGHCLFLRAELPSFPSPQALKPGPHNVDDKKSIWIKKIKQ